MVAKGDCPTPGECPLTKPADPTMFQNEDASMTDAPEDGYYEEYMMYGDGAMIALMERETEETIISGGTRESVRENLESALWKWFNYFFGGKEDENQKSESEGV